MKNCKQCGTEIPNHKQFCNNSCAAKYNNKRRKPRSEASKKKTSESIKKHHKENPMSDKTKEKISKAQIGKTQSIETKEKISKSLKELYKENPEKHSKFNALKPTIVGEFSTLYNCTCKHCNLKMLLPSPKQYCEECKENHSNLRMRFQFNFNVYHYPDLFDLDLLNENGWYAPRGKSGKWNPNGLSRDHKVSIAEAIKNNYDSYYITHPMNCELMPHSENQKKHSECSLSYSSLKQLVDEYDNKQ